MYIYIYIHPFNSRLRLRPSHLQAMRVRRCLRCLLSVVSLSLSRRFADVMCALVVRFRFDFLFLSHPAHAHASTPMGVSVCSACMHACVCLCVCVCAFSPLADVFFLVCVLPAMSSAPKRQIQQKRGHERTTTTLKQESQPCATLLREQHCSQVPAPPSDCFGPFSWLLLSSHASSSLYSSPTFRAAWQNTSSVATTRALTYASARHRNKQRMNALSLSLFVSELMLWAVLAAVSLSLRQEQTPFFWLSPQWHQLALSLYVSLRAWPPLFSRHPSTASPHHFPTIPRLA